MIPSRGPDSWMFPAAQLISTAALGPKSGLGQRARARLLKMTPVCPGSRTAGQPEGQSHPRNGLVGLWLGVNWKVKKYPNNLGDSYASFSIT